MFGKNLKRPVPPGESSSEQTVAADSATGSAPAEQNEAPGKMSEIASMIGNHKGKLAVGAAAMLGLAVFYKWRENKLAKEDPEEYARLQRLKAAIQDDAGTPEGGEQGKST